MLSKLCLRFLSQKSTYLALPTLRLRSKHVLPTFCNTLPPTEAFQDALQAMKMTWGGIELPPHQMPCWKASQRLAGASRPHLPPRISLPPAQINSSSVRFANQDLPATIIKLYYRIRVELRSCDGSPADPADDLRIRLAAELRCSGFQTSEKLWIPRLCGSRPVGWGCLDLLVESVIVVVIVGAERLHPAHQHQLRLLLQDSALAIGLLFNAGGHHPDYRREDNPDQ